MGVSQITLRFSENARFGGLMSGLERGNVPDQVRSATVARLPLETNNARPRSSFITASGFGPVRNGFGTLEK